MLMTTTNNVEGKRILHYYGIVSGETIIGANMFRDLFASIRDIVGGRAGSYEEVLRQAKDSAMKEMCDEAMRLGANAVIGIDLDFETEVETEVCLWLQLRVLLYIWNNIFFIG